MINLLCSEKLFLFMFVTIFAPINKIKLFFYHIILKVLHTLHNKLQFSKFALDHFCFKFDSCFINAKNVNHNKFEYKNIFSLRMKTLIPFKTFEMLCFKWRKLSLEFAIDLIHLALWSWTCYKERYKKIHTKIFWPKTLKMYCSYVY